MRPEQGEGVNVFLFLRAEEGVVFPWGKEERRMTESRVGYFGEEEA